jgi:hypothetical protein
MRVDRLNSGSLELPQVTQSGSLASRDGSANKTLLFLPRRAVSQNLKIPGPFWVCARQRVAPQVVTVQLDGIEKVMPPITVPIEHSG